MATTFRYYPVTPDLAGWGLYVTCVGQHTTPPGAPFPSAVHPDEYYFTWDVGRRLQEWQIFLVTDGAGECESKVRHVQIGAGTLVVLPPGCWHRYRPDPATGWSTVWIGFDGDLAERLVGQAGFRKGDDIFVRRVSSTVEACFRNSLDTLLNTVGNKPFSTATHVPMLIAAILESADGGDSRRMSADPIPQAQAYINDHSAETIDFETLACTLGLSYRSFRYQFARKTGESPLHYQLSRRLARAKNLLASSDMPIADIAEKLGFNSTWYFTHFFQKHTRSSPSAYRKAHHP